MSEETNEQSVVVNAHPVSTREGKESPHHDPESSADPTYAQVTLSKPEHNLPPPETDKVVYDDPQKFVNAHVAR